MDLTHLHYIPETSRLERTASPETISYTGLRLLSLYTGSDYINWVIENMSSAGQHNKCMQNDDTSFVCFSCCMSIHSAINNTLGSLTCSCCYPIVLKYNNITSGHHMAFVKGLGHTQAGHGTALAGCQM